MVIKDYCAQREMPCLHIEDLAVSSLSILENVAGGECTSLSLDILADYMVFYMLFMEAWRLEIPNENSNLKPYSTVINVVVVADQICRD